jgi:hypothetical protein
MKHGVAKPHYVGERFGRLMIEKALGGRKFLCRCDCGGSKIVSGPNLRHSDPKRSVRSCGCLAKEYLSGARSSGLYVGGKKHPIKAIYDGMRSRCLNTSQKSYPAYGGRGIRVCSRWLGEDGFKNFYADMGGRPSENHTLDRVDVDGDYSPENCRWATREQQTSNRRPYTLIQVNELERLRSIEKLAKEAGLTSW